MVLPLFNLAEIIQRYSQSERNKHKSDFKLDRNHGFLFFDKEHLDQTNATIEALNHGVDVAFFRVS